MSQATFLGTPLTKYEIDDVGIGASKRSIKTFYESKELQHKQNRERIRKNRLNDLYTVDTKEGWVPSNFKSSRAHRASYSFQRVSNFTDADDTDFLSKQVLNSVVGCPQWAQVARSVTNILLNCGYLHKRRLIGPTMPPRQMPQRGANDLRGVAGENHEGDNLIPSEDGTWITSKKVTGEAKRLKAEEVKPAESHTSDQIAYHRSDRDVDLLDVKSYYASLFDVVVAPVISQESEEKVQIKKIEFCKQGEGIVKNKAKEMAYSRVEQKYQFSAELLSKFKIKAKQCDMTDSVIKDGDVPKEAEVKLPQELFSRIFNA